MKKLNKKKQIAILSKALRFYRRVGGTKVIMLPFTKEKGFVVENGFIADEAMFKAGVTKKLVVKRKYTKGE